MLEELHPRNTAHRMPDGQVHPVDEQLAPVRVERPDLGERGYNRTGDRVAVSVEHLEADQAGFRRHPAQGPVGRESGLPTMACRYWRARSAR